MKRMLGDFIYTMRKERGYSQAELGELLGVSNKAVSKWETGEANPDLDIIKDLADALEVTADELLSCKRNDAVAAEKENGEKNESGRVSVSFSFNPKNLEYKSKAVTKKGVPLVHINFSSFGAKAHGVVAIGFRAKGILAIGLLPVGIFSFGLLPVGLFAFGIFALGLLCAAGTVAIALGVAAGAVAVGSIAVGAVAVGYLSVGAIAVGVHAHTGAEGIAYGIHTYIHAASSLNYASFMREWTTLW